MKSEITQHINLSRVLLISIYLISFVYALSMNFGLYGFGKDFYGSYIITNLSYGDFRDRLGWFFATLTIGQFHVGVFITSILVSSSSLSIIAFYTKYFTQKKVYIFSFILIGLITIHTWPILMSTSNAMRQGIMMSFLYFAIMNLEKSKFKVSLVFLVLMILSHKAGVFLLYEVFIAYLAYRKSTGKIKYLIFAALSGVLLYFLIEIFYTQTENKIIGKDFSKVFLLLSFMVLPIVKPWRVNKRSFLECYIYLFLIHSPVLYVTLQSYQFERLWMVNLILVIVFMSSRFVRQQVSLVMALQMASLLFLTYVTGMFSELT
jgi:hypothetical protein